jgi:hypothetical protein
VCGKGSEVQRTKKDGASSQLSIVKAKAKAAGNTRQPTIAGEERKFTSTNASAKNKGLPV